MKVTTRPGAQPLEAAVSAAGGPETVRDTVLSNGAAGCSPQPPTGATIPAYQRSQNRLSFQRRMLFFRPGAVEMSEASCGGGGQGTVSLPARGACALEEDLCFQVNELQEAVSRLHSFRGNEKSNSIFSKALQIPEPELISIVKEEQAVCLCEIGKYFVMVCEDEGWKHDIDIRVRCPVLSAALQPRNRFRDLVAEEGLEILSSEASE